MYKGIGFDRTIHLAWLDAAVAYRLETDDPAILRQRLEPVVGAHLTGVDARRKTIDILLRLWSKSEANATWQIALTQRGQVGRKRKICYTPTHRRLRVRRSS